MNNINMNRDIPRVKRNENVLKVLIFIKEIINSSFEKLKKTKKITIWVV
jgi:hypothetical protein